MKQLVMQRVGLDETRITGSGEKLRFCAVAVSTTSSLAPLKPRSRSRSSFRMRFGLAEPDQQWPTRPNARISAVIACGSQKSCSSQFLLSWREVLTLKFNVRHSA